MTKFFLYICIYRPPQSNIKDFYESLTEILTFINDKSYHAIFLFGDFNLDLLQQNDNIQEFINLMYNYSLFPLTTLPIRIIPTSATLIDHIWSSLVEHNLANYIFKTYVTDHYPVLSIFKCDKSAQSEPTYTSKRIFSQANLHKFNHILSQGN